MSFPTKLKELRLSNNLTQKQLAEKINVHPKTYSKYESGQTTPRIPVIRNLIIALNTTCDELLELK